MATFNINSLKEVLKGVREPTHANDRLELYLPDRLDSLNLRSYVNNYTATAEIRAQTITLVAQTFNSNPQHRWFEWALYIPTVEVTIHDK